MNHNPFLLKKYLNYFLPGRLQNFRTSELNNFNFIKIFFAEKDNRKSYILRERLTPEMHGHEGPVDEAGAGVVLGPGVQEGAPGALGRVEVDPEVAPLPPGGYVDQGHDLEKGGKFKFKF